LKNYLKNVKGGALRLRIKAPPIVTWPENSKFEKNLIKKINRVRLEKKMYMCNNLKELHLLYSYLSKKQRTYRVIDGDKKEHYFLINNKIGDGARGDVVSVTNFNNSIALKMNILKQSQKKRILTIIAKRKSGSELNKNDNDQLKYFYNKLMREVKFANKINNNCKNSSTALKVYFENDSDNYLDKLINMRFTSFPVGLGLYDVMANNLLLEMISSNKKLIYEITEKMLLILKCLYDSNLVYGDFKFENLILTPDGNIRLIDFDTVFKADGKFRKVGTREYFPPETNDRSTVEGGTVEGGYINHKSDVYVIGLLLTIILTTSPDMFNAFKLNEVKLINNIRIDEKTEITSFIKKITEYKNENRPTIKNIIDDLKDSKPYTKWLSRFLNVKKFEFKEKITAAYLTKKRNITAMELD